MVLSIIIIAYGKLLTSTWISFREIAVRETSKSFSFSIFSSWIEIISSWTFTDFSSIYKLWFKWIMTCALIFTSNLKISFGQCLKIHMTYFHTSTSHTGASILFFSSIIVRASNAAAQFGTCIQIGQITNFNKNHKRIMLSSEFEIVFS